MDVGMQGLAYMLDGMHIDLEQLAAKNLGVLAKPGHDDLSCIGKKLVDETKKGASPKITCLLWFKTNGPRELNQSDA